MIIIYGQNVKIHLFTLGKPKKLQLVFIGALHTRHSAFPKLCMWHIISFVPASDYLSYVNLVLPSVYAVKRHGKKRWHFEVGGHNLKISDCTRYKKPICLRNLITTNFPNACRPYHTSKNLAAIIYYAFDHTKLSFSRLLQC